MLAYVFAHQPAEDADIAAYEEALRRFHQELAKSGPAGFVASTTFRLAEGYSDWYLVQSSAALDFLNEAAVSGSRAAHHDAAAGMAASGTGKLLMLAQGEATLSAGHETLFAKPAGMSYADLYARLQPFSSGPGAGLWRRMMVLGPPPEFCLVTTSPVELPVDLAPKAVGRRQI
jgi:hypothetical protein